MISRRGLFIIDLEAPLEIPRFLPQGGTWDVADVQWNPHRARAEYIVSTSSEKLYVLVYCATIAYSDPSLIWNLMMVGKSSIEHILRSHYRAITDINWHTSEPDTVSSVGIDSWLWSWDLREPRKPVMGELRLLYVSHSLISSIPQGSVDSTVRNLFLHLQPSFLTPSQPEAHKLNGIARTRMCLPLPIWTRSSFGTGGLVFWVCFLLIIYDIGAQKGSLPTARIRAHHAKIYGIDWAHTRMNDIVTCSLDKTIKVWNIQDTSSPDFPQAESHLQKSSKRLPQPLTTITTRYPVWRARNLPFGRGILSLPQRGETALEMWVAGNDMVPVETFEGHTDVVKEFVWRMGGLGTFLSIS